MRLIPSIFFFLLSFTAIAQAPPTTKIKLSLGDCRNNSAYPSFRTDTISFYKLPEDTFAFLIIPRQHRRFPIELNDIPVSAYKVKYKNNFSQAVTRQVNISDQRINRISICPDSLEDYPKNILAQLQDHDTIAIAFNSRGCFHGYTFKLIIARETGNFIARLYNASFNYIKNEKGIPQWQFNTGELLLTAILTDENIRDFIRFENELKYAYDGGCTTRDMYEVKSNGSNIIKFDGSCQWRGFQHLNISFFGEKKYWEVLGYSK